MPQDDRYNEPPDDYREGYLPLFDHLTSRQGGRDRGPYNSSMLVGGPYHILVGGSSHSRGVRLVDEDHGVELDKVVLIAFVEKPWETGVRNPARFPAAAEAAIRAEAFVLERVASPAHQPHGFVVLGRPVERVVITITLSETCGSFEEWLSDLQGCNPMDLLPLLGGK